MLSPDGMLNGRYQREQAVPEAGRRQREIIIFLKGNVRIRVAWGNGVEKTTLKQSAALALRNFT